MLLSGSTGAGASEAVAEPTFVSRSWTTEHGLPNNSITAIAQTLDGYIWLGTENGVVRFDGVRFKIFGLKDGLGSIRVNSLLVDRQGALWVGTYGGLNRWERGRFETWTTRDGLANDNVRGLLEDAEGTLWIRTWTGLSRRQQGRFTTFSAKEGLTDRRVLALAQDRQGTLWVATAPGGLFQFREGKFLPVAGPREVSAVTANCLLGDRAGNLWASVRGKLLCRRAEQWTVYGKEQGLSGDDVSCIMESADGTIWIPDAGGRLHYLNQGKFMTLTNLPGLSDKLVTALAEDREGNFWLGTYREGLNRLTRAKVATHGTEQGYFVMSVGESPDGSLWVGTSGEGLYRASGGRLEPSDLGETAKRYSHYYAVLPTQGGDLWCGVNGALLYSKRGQPASPCGLDQIQKGEEVRALCEDGAGGVWVGTGLGRVLRAYQGQLSLASDRLSGKLVTALLREPDGGVWIGTGGGLFRLNGGTLAVFTRTNGLLSDYIRALYRSTDGALWIGTAGGGLSRWAGGRLTSFTTDQGLADNVISQIIQDDAGDFWFGSYRGIFRVRQAELHDLGAGKTRFVHPLLLGRAEGMALEECTGGPPCIKVGSGELCFTTVRGLVVVDPKKFNTRAPPPRVLIEEMLVDDKPLYPPTGANSEPIRVPPGKHQIEFRYTGLNAGAPERLQFKHRLEGWERWVEAGSERVVRYPTIRPGRYNFSVTACDSDDVWNENGAELAFMVLPHYWETGWFRLGTGLLLIALGGMSVWSWSRHRIARALERESLAVERQQLRAELAHSSRVSAVGQLAASVAHELNQPLGAILANAEAAELFLQQDPPAFDDVRAILADIRKDDERAGEVIRRMRTLLRKHELEREPIEINPLVEDVLHMVRGDAALREIALDANLGPDLPKVAGDRVHLQQVLLNLILNGMDALAEQPHERRRILVRTRLDADGLVELAVIDSGHGIEPDKLPHLFEPFYTTKPNGLGMGLSIARTIIEAHHGRIWAENNETGGAVFRIALPSIGRSESSVIAEQ